MKKGLLALTSVALTGCMLLCFAGCGAASKAKSIRGEQVTEEEWNTAMAETASLKSDSSSLPVQTVADETAEAANFKVEYEMKGAASVSYESRTDGQSVSLDLKISVSGELVAANNALYVKVSYDFNLNGSEELVELIGIPEEANGKYTVEAYVSSVDYGFGLGFIVKDSEGNWVSGTASMSELAKSMVDSLIEEVNQSALVGAFSNYQYSEEHKGYVLLDGGISGGLGGGLFDVGANLVLKIKDNHLAAIYSSAETNVDSNGLKMSGSSEVGYVYTYGGQSVTVPTVG